MTNAEHEHHHSKQETPVDIVKKASTTNILLLIAVGMLLFGGGYKLGENRSVTQPPANANFVNVQSREDAKTLDFNLFWETWNKMEEKYVDQSKLNKEKMFYGAIKGMVASVEDPYTFFLTPDENKKSKDDLGGKFEGIGAQLGLKDGAIVVVAPLKESPAEKAGIKAGDYVVAVNGKSTEGWTLNEAVNEIRGEGGTKVKLTLNRAGKKIDVEVTRDTIKVESIELTYENAQSGKVAVVKINQFGDTTNSEWNTAIDEVVEQYSSGQIKGMVLDVRDNPGGYLESSVYIASEFLPGDAVVVKQESTIEDDRTYTVRRNGRLQDIPLVVLINQGSASASEILAGALRDHGRAQLIGAKSFGKGSVQEALDLDKGAGLHVTVAKWILPKGDWINSKGITPAITVENTIPEGNTMTREFDAQLDRALEEVGK